MDPGAKRLFKGPKGPKGPLGLISQIDLKVATFTKKDGLKIVNNNLYGNFLAKADQPNSLFTKWTEKKKR